MVSAYGDEGGTCELASWRGSAAGQIVNVTCHSTTGAFQQRDFTVTYAATNNLMGQNGRTEANALATGTASSYRPAVQYDSAPGARVTVTHLSTGIYRVAFAGSEGNSARGGDVQVGAVATSNAHSVASTSTPPPTPQPWTS